MGATSEKSFVPIGSLKRAVDFDWLIPCLAHFHSALLQRHHQGA
jgi:hypothetical protein